MNVSEQIYEELTPKGLLKVSAYLFSTKLVAATPFVLVELDGRKVADAVPSLVCGEVRSVGRVEFSPERSAAITAAYDKFLVDHSAEIEEDKRRWVADDAALKAEYERSRNPWAGRGETGNEADIRANGGLAGARRDRTPRHKGEIDGY